MTVESNRAGVDSPRTPDVPITELMTQLSGQVSRLVRDEMRLAQKEFQESAKHAGIGAGLFSVAGLLAMFAFATLIAATVAAVALVVPVWAAALIVAAVLVVTAGVAALLSRRQVQQVSAVPQTATENIKKDIEHVKDAGHDRS
jgi:Flp pilus assembly protein TadB